MRKSFLLLLFLACCCRTTLIIDDDNNVDENNQISNFEEIQPDSGVVSNNQELDSGKSNNEVDASNDAEITCPPHQIIVSNSCIGCLEFSPNEKPSYPNCLLELTCPIWFDLQKAKIHPEYICIWTECNNSNCTWVCGCMIP